MGKTVQRSSAALLLGLMLATPLSVSAAGFSLLEQGQRGQGHAFAGAAAFGDDASTIYFNPAAMSRLDRREMIVGTDYIDLRGDFTKEEARDVIGQPLSGGEGGNIGGDGVLVPNFYYHQPIDDRMNFGFGVTVPFGLGTHYDDDSVWRYQARDSDVAIINLTPQLSWRLDDQWSIGGGLNFHYMEVELGNAVDLGAACFGAADPVTCQDFELTPQAADLDAHIEGDGWGVGFNIGALWEHEDWRVGVHYRSRVDHSLDGRARFRPEDLNETQQTAFNNLFVGQGFFGGESGTTPVDADFTSPDTFSVGVAHELTDRWTLLGDVTWMGWSSFDELVVELDDPIGPEQDEIREVQNYEDDLRVGLGFDFHHSEQWSLRAGVAYDESPVQREFRTPRLPDTDRTWISGGATWRLSPNSELDFAYTHIMLDDDIPVDHTGNQGDRVTGTFDVSTNIFSFGYRHLFD